MPYLVRLKANWPGNFRRSVRFDSATGEQVLRGGEVLELLEFSPGELCELDETEFRAIAADIGHAIEHVRLSENGDARASEEPVEVQESEDAIPESADSQEAGDIRPEPKARNRRRKR